MIGVNRDIVTLDVPHHDAPLAAIFRLGGKGHSHRHLVDALERRPRHYLDQLGVVLPVAVGRVDHNLEGIPLGFTHQSAFQAGNDVAGAVQILERIRPIRAVDDGPLLVREGIVDTDDRVVADKQCHGVLPGCRYLSERQYSERQP